MSVFNKELAKVLGIDVMELELATAKAEKAVAKAEKDELKKLDPMERMSASMKKIISESKLSKRIFKGVPLPSDKGYICDLVSMYYQIQSNRIKMGNQLSALERDDANADSLKIMNFFTEQLATSEANIQTFLNVWTDRDPVGVWMKAQYGIGPVIAAGISANFDVAKAKSAGGFWHYIGWDGKTPPRKKGVKCTFNPKARVLAWKAGNSFKMGYKKEECYYGQLYARKKDEYIRRNETGGFAETAAKELAEKKFTDKATIEKLKSGKILDAHIDAMALRFAAKMFLSHVFDVMYIMTYGQAPPMPYVVDHLGHVHVEHPKKLEVLRESFNKKFPDRDFDKLIFEAYHITLEK